MDAWLDTLGLFRKNTAMDGSCLFRAVLEQLSVFIPEDGHIMLRNQMLDFMLEHRQDFEGKIKEASSLSIEEYVSEMRDPNAWAGPIEVEALSKLYQVDFEIYPGAEKPPYLATNNGFEKVLKLCFINPCYYDSIYTSEHINNSAFCQSIVYSILYGNVFKLSDLDYAVKKMLHDKSARAQREAYLNNQNWSREDNCVESYIEEGDEPIKVKELIDQGAILFPYKVAKALDPNVFRNISFDCWQDRRGSNRKGKAWFTNGAPLRLGVKCAVTLDNRTCTGYIQTMTPDHGPVEIYVEESKEKVIVPYESLTPLPRTSVRPEWSFSLKHQQINKMSLKITADSEKKKMKGRKSLFHRSTGISPHVVLVKQEQSPNANKSTVSSESGIETSEEVVITSSPAPVPANFLKICAPVTLGEEITTINTAARKVSSDEELNMYDPPTRRFFFNLGIEYFGSGFITYPLPPGPPKNSLPSPIHCSTPSFQGQFDRRRRGIKAPRFQKLDMSQELDPSSSVRQRSADDSGFSEMSPKQICSFPVMLTPDVKDEAFYSVPLPEMCPMPAFPSMGSVPLVPFSQSIIDPTAPPAALVDGLPYYGFETPPPEAHFQQIGLPFSAPPFYTNEIPADHCQYDFH